MIHITGNPTQARRVRVIRRVFGFLADYFHYGPLAERLDHSPNELAMAAGTSNLASGTKINPNTAARDELMKLPGVGEVTANRIIGGRPYKKPSDLLTVESFGPKTLERLTPYLQIP